MKSKPIIIRQDHTGKSLVPIRPDEKKFSEKWLQELLQNHPHILPVDEIDPVFFPLIPIGREVATSVGFIDNLFISQSGYLVIVETKLWRNPEAKRKVLAQAIDYAGELSNWSFKKLNDESKKNHNTDLIDLIQRTYDSDADEVPDEDIIIRNLRSGRFLILVVSDRIRKSLIDTLTFINRFPHLAANVGLIEMQCYLLPDNQDDILVVPSIAAKTEIVERSIVQINLTPGIEHQVSVEKIKSEPGGRKKTVISEEAYWDAMKRKSPARVIPVKRIFDHFNDFSTVNLKPRQSSFTARLVVPDSDIQISLFFINTDGRLTCWPKIINEQLENAGLDPSLGISYEKQIGRLLIHKTKKQEIYCQVENLDIDEFFTIVDEFINQVLKEKLPEGD